MFLFGCAGSLLPLEHFSSCGKRGLLSVAVCGLLIAVASLVSGHGLQGVEALVAAAGGFSSCDFQALELCCRGLVALRHVGASQTREEGVFCIGRRILDH